MNEEMCIRDSFKNHGIIEFSFNGKAFMVYIEDVACFPQAYRCV